MKPVPKTLKDFDVYACICKGLASCTCGAWSAARKDYEHYLNVVENNRRARLNELRDFLIKPPTPPITFKTMCPTCQHDLAKHLMNAAFGYECDECGGACSP
jgi:hypothetical protein